MKRHLDFTFIKNLKEEITEDKDHYSIVEHFSKKMGEMNCFCSRVNTKTLNAISFFFDKKFPELIINNFKNLYPTIEIGEDSNAKSKNYKYTIKKDAYQYMVFPPDKNYCLISFIQDLYPQILNEILHLFNTDFYNNLKNIIPKNENEILFNSTFIDKLMIGSNDLVLMDFNLFEKLKSFPFLEFTKVQNDSLMFNGIYVKGLKEIKNNHLFKLGSSAFSSNQISVLIRKWSKKNVTFSKNIIVQQRIYNKDFSNSYFYSNLRCENE